jgi:hypothetical protein
VGGGGRQEKYRGKWKPQEWTRLGHDGNAPVVVTHDDNEWGIEVCGTSEPPPEELAAPTPAPTPARGPMADGLQFRCAASGCLRGHWDMGIAEKGGGGQVRAAGGGGRGRGRLSVRGRGRQLQPG